MRGVWALNQYIKVQGHIIHGWLQGRLGVSGAGAMAPRFDRGLTVVRYSWFQLISLFGISVSVSTGLNQLLSAMQVNLFKSKI